MSFKKSKLDLLVRVRYSNPLPPPPCPPKLLDIPTDPMRFAQPEFLNDIAADTPLPMIIDAECGMPLDLGKWECLWEQGADDTELNPDPKNLPELDPKDQFLLLDLASSTGNYTSGSFSTPGSGTSTPTPMPHVSWLRKTEYLSRDSGSRNMAHQELKHTNDTPVDVSHSAQIRDIEASFSATETTDLSTLKHPNKPDVVAVEAYEVLPDAQIWGNAYDLFRFAERPGDRPLEVEDPRLDCAILRPMEADGDHFLAYYLTKEDEGAVDFKNRRVQKLEDLEGEEPVAFHLVRDYEVVKVDQDVPNEFLLVLDEGDADTNASNWRLKGAYYKNIERKMLLKKRRVNAYDAYGEKWDVVKVTHVEMDDEEKHERDEVLAEVTDPLYYLGRGEADADAEGEVDMEALGTEGRTNGDTDAVDVFG